jgi:hypothetical protein
VNSVLRWIQRLLHPEIHVPAPRRDFGPKLVTGFVGVHGAGGVRAGPDGPWTLRVTLEPWRHPRDGIQSRPLVLSRACTAAELDALRARLRPYAPVTARVDLENWVVGELLELVDAPVDDPRLAARAAPLAARPTRQDPRFGTLTLVGPGAYEAAATWNGSAVVLRLEMGDDDDDMPDAALATARALWDDEAGWHRRVGNHAVAELLEVKNENWPDDDDAQPLTPDGFRARMRLEMIATLPDGEFVFYHEHGDLFWDHVVQVGGSLREGVTDAAVEG